MRIKILFICIFILCASQKYFAQGTWAAKASLPGVGRTAPITFAIGTKGYVGTGGNISTGAAYSDFWEYDPATNTWTQKANFGGGIRVYAVGFSIANYGYVGTGRDQALGGLGNFYNDLWRYEPLLNTWTKLANVGGAVRSYAFGFSMAGKGYIGTGANLATYLNDMWEYDPANNTWTAKANYMGGNRIDIDRAVFVICDKAYLGTGRDDVGTGLAANKQDFWEYDPATNSWSQKANFQGNPREGATGFSIGSMGYLGLGSYFSPIITTPSTYFNDFWKYDPSINSWSPVASLPGVSRLDASAFVINNKAYVACGSYNTTPKVVYKDLYEYTPASVTGNLIVTGSSSTICAGQPVTLTASGGSSYTWDNGSTTNPFVVFPSATTTYSVTSTGTSCSGSNTATITITLGNLNPTTTASNNTICAGQVVTLTSSGGSTYAWNTGETTSYITASPTTTTTYSVLASAGSCSGTSSITVNVNAGTTPVITGTTLICSGDVATLTASGGNSYLWSNGESTSSITVSPATTTNYSVSVAGGCSGTATTTVSVTNAITALIACQDVCGGSGATLVASGGSSYLWSTGAVTSAITVAPAASSSYSVIVGPGSSCADTTNCTVNVFPAPVVSAASDTTITEGQSVILTATGGGTYAWSDGSTDDIITVSPVATTPYCVIVTDANGCKDSACVTVTVENPCSISAAGELYVPNAFSPNGDGENDVLEVYYGNFNCVKSLEMTIYNRWGEKIFETTDTKNPWDGTFKGKKMNPAVFVYYLKVTLITDLVITKKGNVSLMK